MRETVFQVFRKVSKALINTSFKTPTLNPAMSLSLAQEHRTSSPLSTTTDP